MLKRLFFLVLLSVNGGIALAQTQEEEANLKAAFIYNFTRYIDWEKSSAETEFVIGIAGPSVLTAPLMEIAKTKMVNNKPITIRVFEKPEDITYCHILFIPQKLPYSINAILGRVEKGTLTISEEPGYAKQGVAFNFVIINDKLKFEANLKSIVQAGLKASSQLLKLAIII